MLSDRELRERLKVETDPVKLHEMGKIFPIGDSAALAEALLEVLSNKQAYLREPEPIRQGYIPESIALEYEKLFTEIQRDLEK